MSGNSLSSKSPYQAAALDLTLAVIAKSEFGNPLSSAAGSVEVAKRQADYVNTLFNEILENLKKS